MLLGCTIFAHKGWRDPPHVCCVFRLSNSLRLAGCVKSNFVVVAMYFVMMQGNATAIHALDRGTEPRVPSGEKTATSILRRRCLALNAHQFPQII